MATAAVRRLRSTNRMHRTADGISTEKSVLHTRRSGRWRSREGCARASIAFMGDTCRIDRHHEPPEQMAVSGGSAADLLQDVRRMRGPHTRRTATRSPTGLGFPAIPHRARTSRSGEAPYDNDDLSVYRAERRRIGAFFRNETRESHSATATTASLSDRLENWIAKRCSTAVSTIGVAANKQRAIALNKLRAAGAPMGNDDIRRARPELSALQIGDKCRASRFSDRWNSAVISKR